MKIVFDPPRTKLNKYSEIITSALERKGVKVVSIKEFFKSPKLMMSVEVVHLNWYENLDNGWDFIKKAVKLLFFQVSGKRIFWTMHNRFPHEKSVRFLKNVLLNWLVSSSSKIIIHSKVSEELLIGKYKGIENKIVYIPHPNYVDKYGPQQSQQEETDKLKLLFIGAVKPYKNIEMLIQLAHEFRDTVNLKIAGKPLNYSYEKGLREMVVDCNHIEMNLFFVNDEDLVRFLAECDLVVLPYNLESSLNSGTVLLAFSYGRTVICPEIGTIQEIGNFDKLFTYNYRDQAEHLERLREMMALAVKRKSDDTDVFKKLGAEMKEIVKLSNDNNKIAEMYYHIYNTATKKI